MANDDLKDKAVRMMKKMWSGDGKPQAWGGTKVETEDTPPCENCGVKIRPYRLVKGTK